MVTKSTGIGRGGKRPGAGRKPKHAGSAKETERHIGEAVKSVVAALSEPRAIANAADLVAKAYATLEDVMDNSPFPAPRVTAARAVLDLARAEAEDAKPNGKKAVRQAAADQATASGGKFAQRSGPRLVASNS